MATHPLSSQMNSYAVTNESQYGSTPYEGWKMNRKMMPATGGAIPYGQRTAARYIASPRTVWRDGPGPCDEQARPEGQGRHARREHEAGQDRPVVLGIDDKLSEGVQSDEEPLVAERRGPEEGEAQRLEGGPEEKCEGHRELRQHEQVGQPP